MQDGRDSSQKPAEKPQKPADKPQRSGEKKGPQLGGNYIIWYLLALGLGIMLIASVVADRRQVRIRYSDLVRLIEQGNKEKASVDVTDGEGTKAETVRYSKLAKLTIGPDESTGTGTVEDSVTIAVAAESSVPANPVPYMASISRSVRSIQATSKSLGTDASRPTGITWIPHPRAARI